MRPKGVGECVRNLGVGGERDQERQLERLAETDAADLLRRRLGDKQLPRSRARRKTVRRGPSRSTFLLLRGSGGFPSTLAFTNLSRRLEPERT
jgi:hypothetical protein